MKVLQRKTLYMKPFKSILLGDPLYLEKLKSESLEPKKVKRLKELTLNYRPRCCNCGAVLVEEIEDSYEFEGEEYSFLQIGVHVYLAYNEGSLKTYLNGKWYGEESVKAEHQLGCDTAQFDMYVDGELYSFNKIVEDMAYLFNAKEQ